MRFLLCKPWTVNIMVGMIASELATELNIDAGVLSKRLKLYYGETGEERQRVLPEQIIQHMREVEDLIKKNQATSTRVAVLMVLGKHVEAAPPSSVQRIETLLLQLLDGQVTLNLKLDQLQTRHSNRTETDSTKPSLSKISPADVDQYFKPVEDVK